VSDEQTQGPLKLMSLEIENILRVQAVYLEMGPDGVLQIEGGNEQGKTSVLRALELLMAGKNADAAPAPLHGDATKGQIIATIGHLVVTKKYREGKGPVLTVTVGKGKKLAKPQTILDDLMAHYTLNPLKFMAMDDKKKLETLAAFLEFDQSEFDAEEARLTDERKYAKKEAQRLTSAMVEAPRHTNAPEKVIDVKELMEELQERQRINAVITERARACVALEDEITQIEQGCKMLSVDIGVLQQQVASKKAKMAERKEVLARHRSDLEVARKESLKDQEVNEQEITDKINAADELNRMRRDNDRHNELRAEAQAAGKKADDLEEAVKAIRAKKDKARAAAAAKLPLPDLALTEDAVLYKGKPLSQAGRSAQLRVSTAVAIAMNEDKQVRLLLIDDAEKLDPDGTKALLEMAKAEDFQVIMTRVTGAGGPSEGAVVIEDGKVGG